MFEFDKSIQTRLQQSKISMSDIELLSAYLMNEKPDLAYSFSEEYDYWLIDEFQDRLSALIESDEADEVYMFNMQFFPLTKKVIQ